MRAMDALPEIVTEHLGEVRALCEKYSVRKLTIFGSAVKGTFDPEKSDLDFAVEFLPDPDPLERGRHYLDLLIGLQQSFGREVDLVSVTGIRNPYFKEVLRLTQRPLYDIDTQAA
ncbi:MAG TPA: nucleotidyltransferase domain-containing protein [Thermoanaerobaculia bacterium]